VFANLQSNVERSGRSLVGTLPVSSRASGTRVREALFEDYPQICALERRYGLATRDFEEWKHFWEGNPACADLPPWPKGWVLESDSGKVVGFLGNVPRSYQFEGRRFLAAAGHAWVVDSSHRNHAVLLLNAYFRQQNVDLYLCSSANQYSAGILSVFNSSRVPVGSWDRSIFWITDPSAFLASWLRMKALPPHPILRNALGAALRLSDLLRSRFSHPQEGEEHEVECCDSFDSRFEIFWERLVAQKPRLFLAVRNRETLSWHFKYVLRRQHAWVVTVSHSSGLNAYAIFSRQDNARHGLERMRLVDFQALDGHDSLVLPILRHALRKSREQGIHMLECVGTSPRLLPLLTSLHPRHRRLPSWSYYYTPASQMLAARLAAPEAWDPTYFDGDSSL
jgi:hypothetical protein